MTPPNQQPLSFEHRSGTKDFLKTVIGNIFISVFPGRATMLKENPTRYADSRIDRWIMHAIVSQAIRIDDADLLSKIHRREWAVDLGVEFAKNTQYRFETWFLSKHVATIDVLDQHLSKVSERTTLCELGTGGAQVLHYLAGRFPRIKRFVGLDICADQIEVNKASNANDQVEFHAGDALHWIHENGEKDWVFVSNGGVLEYFSQSELEQLYHKVASDCGPSTFVIIEPIAADHDLESQIDSKPFGEEKSFSHNHHHLLRKSGFDIVHEEETIVDEYRYVQIIAECGEPRPVGQSGAHDSCVVEFH